MAAVTSERTSFTVRLVDRPAYAPELLALAAVDTLGPAALAWVRRVRAVYPSATPDGLARLATERSVRLGTAGGAASAAAGLFAPLAGLSVLAVSQASLVLRLAAAYGLDPTHPDRAVDLLVLTGVHADDEAARAALAAAQAAEPEHLLHRSGGLALPGSLVAWAGGWLSLRLASRVLPGAALVAAVANGSAAAERLAARAVARYRGRQSQSNHSAGSRA